MMVRGNNQELLMDIRERVVAIETHLKDMNGKLIKHENILNETCPMRHSKIDENIANLKSDMRLNNWKIASMAAVGTFILMELGTLLVKAIATKLGG